MSLVDVLALVILNFRTWLEIKLTYDVGYGPYNAKILRSWERKGRIGHYTQKTVIIRLFLNAYQISIVSLRIGIRVLHRKRIAL